MEHLVFLINAILQFLWFTAVVAGVTLNLQGKTKLFYCQMHVLFLNRTSNIVEQHSIIVLCSKQLACFNRPFYSCLVSYLAFEYQQGWR